MTAIDNYLQSNIQFTPAIVCFLIKDDQILLGLRKKVSLDLGLNIWAGIGGKVGDQEEYKNETAEQATVREIFEEVNVTAIKYKQVGRVRFVYPSKPKWCQDVLIYIVTQWEGNLEETETTKPEWFDKDKLPVEQMWEDNPIWIPEILKGQIIDAVFLYGENGKIQEYRLN